MSVPARFLSANRYDTTCPMYSLCRAHKDHHHIQFMPQHSCHAPAVSYHCFKSLFHTMHPLCQITVSHHAPTVSNHSVKSLFHTMHPLCQITVSYHAPSVSNHCVISCTHYFNLCAPLGMASRVEQAGDVEYSRTEML